MSELQAQCWICPHCHDDGHHQPGDSTCLENLKRARDQDAAQVERYRQELRGLFADGSISVDRISDLVKERPSESLRYVKTDALEGIEPVLHEMTAARHKFPTWPTDPLHALGVLQEEVGELSKAVLQAVYEPEKNPGSAVRKEAIQAAAMALRFVASLDRYQFEQCHQHNQEGSDQ